MHSSPQPTPEEQRELELLDDYLERLHRGEHPDREALLREHPQLASALACLEALDGLALPSDVVGDMAGLAPDIDVANLGEPPRLFGDYELLGELGRGGMGVVYKARQASLDRVVALKMILGRHLASDEHVRRFHAEAKAAARVRHPNIVDIHEVGQWHGQDYFAMDFIEGTSLAERMATGPVDIDTAVRLLATVARAVEHLHEQGIVHRDLKPSNILIDPTDQPYVTDFGLAKVFTSEAEATATGVIAGTPSYMAPEQASGNSRDIGPAADVYSLGAIFYELLTGRPPFREENPLDTLMHVLSCDPELPRQLNPKVPRTLELICLKCLAKSPDERYATAGELADELECYARGETPRVRPPTPMRRLWSWARRKPALASRLGALGVFYAVDWGNYLSGSAGVDWAFHWKISIVLAAWAVVSIVCQQCLNRQRWAIPARYVWGTLDSVLLLAVLLIADGAASPLVVGYPLLVVGSGLWFRVRFVTLMTVSSLLSYGVLVLDFYWRRPGLQRGFDIQADRHIIFALSLLVLGIMVAYLVDRVRTLSKFYGQPLP